MFLLDSDWDLRKLIKNISETTLTAQFHYHYSPLSQTLPVTRHRTTTKCQFSNDLHAGLISSSSSCSTAVIQVNNYTGGGIIFEYKSWSQRIKPNNLWQSLISSLCPKTRFDVRSSPSWSIKRFPVSFWCCDNEPVTNLCTKSLTSAFSLGSLGGTDQGQPQAQQIRLWRGSFA